MKPITFMGPRVMSRRFAGGGAIFCTFFRGAIDSAQAAQSDRKLRSPLIVLDAGHGGKDSGARGASGTLEKNITLATVLTLRNLLEGLKPATGVPYRVELTRSGDRYIAREYRADLARERGADLFLSLHADAGPDPAVRGASVYTLAKDASDPETEALAARENGIVPGEPPGMGRVTPEVSDILASLAARETRGRSLRIAQTLVGEMRQDVPVLPTPARQANFTVLQATGIPSVLIEMGFLSNPADEAALNEKAHQALIAGSIARTIGQWFASEGGAAARPI